MFLYIKYLIIVVLISLGTFLQLSDKEVFIPKELIQNQIDLKLPFNIEKKNHFVTINQAKMDLTDNSILINTLLDYSYSKIVLKDVTANLKTSFELKNKEIYLSIQDLEIKNLNKQLDPVEEIIENNKFGLFGKLKNKIVDKAEDFVNNKSEKISEIISFGLSKKPVYKLEGWKAYFIEDITFNKEGFLLKFNYSLVILFSYLISFLLLLREIAILLINFYQKYLSSKKGYKCAQGVLHGNGTCSSKVKKDFKEKGFVGGMNSYIKNKQDCKEAFKTLKERKSSSCKTVDSFVDCDSGGCEIGGCDVGSC